MNGANKPALLLAASLIAIALCAGPDINSFFPKRAEDATHVKGHFKKNGTFVAPHARSKANKSKRDNWSTKGNFNPFTGKQGRKKGDFRF